MPALAPAAFQPVLSAVQASPGERRTTLLPTATASSCTPLLGHQATLCTGASRFQLRRQRPVRTSHRRSVPSSEPEARCCPKASGATLRTCRRHTGHLGSWRLLEGPKKGGRHAEGFLDPAGLSHSNSSQVHGRGPQQAAKKNPGRASSHPEPCLATIPAYAARISTAALVAPCVPQRDRTQQCC